METPLINRDGLEYDTPEWRAQRNAKLYEWVQDEEAVAFITTYANICEVWDDLIDKDKPVSDAQINRAFMQAVVSLPCNEFFIRHRAQILPLIVSGANAWADATAMERHGTENQKVFSYVLRDWYMEFVSFIIYLTRGWEYLRSVSLEVRDFFTHHETLEQYKERFK